jgi:hypothetical protein
MTNHIHLVAVPRTEDSLQRALTPLPVENYLAELTLHPVTAEDTTVGVWTAEFDVTNDDESGVVDAVGNGTFGTAFEVLNEILEPGR